MFIQEPIFGYLQQVLLLFIVAKSGKKSKYSQLGMDKWWPIHAMEYYSALKKNKLFVNPNSIF